MRLKGIYCKLAAVVLAIAMVLVVGGPVLAGLSVSPPRIERNVSVGENPLPKIVVTNTAEDKPMRVRVDVEGFGQSLKGVTTVISDDTGPYSAVSLIKVSPEEFELKPKESQEVQVTATIPPGASGGRYATIAVSQVPESGMSMVGQVAVIAILTISESPLLRAGEIVSTDIHQELPGAPLTFTTTVCNQGNIHIRPTGEIIISKQGQEVGKADVEPHLILPGYTRQLETVWIPSKFNAGTYSFEVTLNLDGTELKAEGSFTLSDTEGVIKVEGGVGEPGEIPETSQPIDWRLIGEIIGGVLIVGILVYFTMTRRRVG